MGSRVVELGVQRGIEFAIPRDDRAGYAGNEQEQRDADAEPSMQADEHGSHVEIAERVRCNIESASPGIRTAT